MKLPSGLLLRARLSGRLRILGVARGVGVRRPRSPPSGPQRPRRPPLGDLVHEPATAAARSVVLDAQFPPKLAARHALKQRSRTPLSPRLRSSLSHDPSFPARRRSCPREATFMRRE